MRFFWPRERALSTDSDASTASESSVASDQSFFSAEENDWFADPVVDPPDVSHGGPSADPADGTPWDTRPVPFVFLDTGDRRDLSGDWRVTDGPTFSQTVPPVATSTPDDDDDDTQAARATTTAVYPHSASSFDCSLCGYTAHDFAALSAHRRAAHRGTPFVDRFAAGCACAAAFTTRAAAAKHASRCPTAPRAAAASRAPSPDAGAPSTTSRDGARTNPVGSALLPALGCASPGPVALAPSPREQRAVSLSVVAPPRVAVVGDKRRRLNSLHSDDAGDVDGRAEAATPDLVLGPAGPSENDGHSMFIEEIDEDDAHAGASHGTTEATKICDVCTLAESGHTSQETHDLSASAPQPSQPTATGTGAPTAPTTTTSIPVATTTTNNPPPPPPPTTTLQQPEPPLSAALDTAEAETVPPTPPAAGASPSTASTRARVAQADGGDDRRRDRDHDGGPLSMPPGLDAATTDAPARPTSAVGTHDVDALLASDSDDDTPTTPTDEDDAPRASREETENALVALLAVLSRTATTMVDATQLLAALDGATSDSGEALEREPPVRHAEAHSAGCASERGDPREAANSDISPPLARDTTAAGENAPRAPVEDEQPHERPPHRPTRWGPRLPASTPPATTRTGSRWGPRLPTTELAQTTRAYSRWGPRLTTAAPTPRTRTPTWWSARFPTSVPPTTTRTRTRWGPRLTTTTPTPATRTYTRWGPRHLQEPAPAATGTHPLVPQGESPEIGDACDVAMTDASATDETTAGASDVDMPTVAPPPSETDTPDDPMPAAAPEEERARGQRGGRRRRKKNARAVELVNENATTATTRRTMHDGIDRGTTTARDDDGTATATQSAEAPTGEHHRRVELVTETTAPTSAADDDGEWTLRFDGACRKNPGPGGAGAALFQPSGAVAWTCFHYLPDRSETNNTAEYAALLSGVESAVHHGVRRLRIEGDSHLVLSQVRGTMACMHKRLRRVRDRIQTLLKRVPTKTLVHIDRKANQHADRLANRALDLRRTEVVCGAHANEPAACCHPEQPFAMPPDSNGRRHRLRADEEHKGEEEEDDQDDDDMRSELDTDDEAEAELAARDDGQLHPALRIDAHSFPVRQPRLVLRAMTADEYDDAAARVATAADRLASAIEDSTDWQQGEGYICAIPTMLRTALEPHARPARPAPVPGQPRQHPRASRPPRITRHQREHRLDEALDELGAEGSVTPRDRRRMKNARRRVARVRNAQASSALRALFTKREKGCVEQILRGTQPDGAPAASPTVCPIDGGTLSAHYTGRAAARVAFDYDDARGELFRRALRESAREPAAGNDDLSDALTVDDVEDQLKHAKGNTSPGHDGIGYDIYKRFTTQISRVLVAAFGLCWRYGRVPASWKVGNVRLIHKKGDESDADNWRPICLQPTIYKVYTGLLARRLSGWLERNARLPMTQKGFRAFNGCHENNFVATTLLDQTRRLHKRLYTVWYDLKDAFGSLPQSLMWRVLQDVGVAPSFIERCRSLYDGALYTVTNAADGETRPITRELGVFQGCPLSPLLFITALTPLLRRLERLEGVGVQLARDVRLCSSAYADDMKLFCDSAEGIRLCHGAVADFLSWTGLRANPAKCAALGVTLNARSNPVLDRDFGLELHGDPIPLLGLHDSYAYLGVGDGFDHARHRVQLDTKISELRKDAVTLLNSKLAPWQILKALKVYVYPRADYALRHVRPLQAQLQAFDAAVERGVRNLLKLPRGATTQLLYSPTSSGGLGLLPLTEQHAALQVAHAWQMMHSRDPAIQATAREQVTQICRARHKLAADHWDEGRRDELVQLFLNSTLSESVHAPPKRRNGDIASLWTDTQRHLRTWGLQLETKTDAGVDEPLHLKVPHHRQWLTHKTVLRHLKLHLKLAHRAQWAAMTDQGRTVRAHGNAGSKFLTSGGGLTEAEYRFAVLARLNQLDTNAVLHRRRLRANKTCRAPGCTRAETTAHVLNHCSRNMDAIRRRHDDALKQIGRALERAHKGTGVSITLNSTVPEYEAAALRPDIVLRDPATRSAVIADLAVTFEDQPNDSASSSTLRHSHDHKVAKYQEVAETLERHGWRVTCAALVYGSLGSVLPSNFATYTEQLGLLKRDAKKLDGALASHCIRASRRVWNWHCSQHRTRQHNRSEQHGSGGNRSQPTSTTQ